MKSGLEDTYGEPESCLGERWKVLFQYDELKHEL
jgi:hypothetical protein